MGITCAYSCNACGHQIATCDLVEFTRSVDGSLETVSHLSVWGTRRPFIKEGWCGFAADAYCKSCHKEGRIILQEFKRPRYRGFGILDMEVEDFLPQYQISDFRHTCPYCGSADWSSDAHAFKNVTCDICGKGQYLLVSEFQF